MFLLSASRQETWEDSDLFKSQPTSDVDAMGKKRYVGKHKHELHKETILGLASNLT